jgi:Sec-independent protein secretion pathway component TatC
MNPMTVYKTDKNEESIASQYDTGEQEDPEHEDQELSFLEHLVELRSRLLKACFAVLVVLVALLPFARKLYALLAAPLTSVLPEGSSMIAIDVASPFLTPFKLALLLALFIPDVHSPISSCSHWYSASSRA